MRILRWLVFIPVVGVALYLSLANRHSVLFSLDPFTPETPGAGASTAADPGDLSECVGGSFSGKRCNLDPPKQMAQRGAAGAARRQTLVG